ncbi:MAG: DUF3224 domain-containing protein [Jiangellaceae bacterium]
MGSGTMTTLEWQETTWEGKPAADVPAPKTTVASDTATITGDIEGEVADRWLMSYAADGTARFVGLTRVTGTVAGRTGTFVLQHAGRFDGEGLHSEFTVVPGSGTGALSEITGAGTFVYTGPAGEPTRYTFEPRFA